MAKRIKLTEMIKGMSYQVAGFKQDSSDYAKKLLMMGFISGTAVALAPVKMSDPLIVEIRGSRVALRKNEAQQILVKEL